jgi:hypothetical protein
MFIYSIKIIIMLCEIQRDFITICTQQSQLKIMHNVIHNNVICQILWYDEVKYCAQDGPTM